MSKREDILARLLEILGGVENIKTAARNLDQFPEGATPAAILLDGDEEFPIDSQTDDVLSGKAWIVLIMYPLIEVMLGDTLEDIGTSANQLLASVQSAILCDDELKEIVEWPVGKIVYAGMDTRISHSMAMTCDAQLRFQIRYILNPQTP